MRDIIAELCAAAERPHGDAERGPVGVSVLVTSTDPEVIAWAGPRLARILFPGRRFGRVIHHEPSAVDGWSEVIVREGSR